MNKKKILTGNKFVIIKSTKPIIQLAGMSGFSSKPFYLNIGMIGSLVNSGHDVYEIVKGQEIKLTPRNYMDDFTDMVVVDEPKKETVVPQIINARADNTVTIEGTYDKFTGGEIKRTIEQSEQQAPNVQQTINNTPVDTNDVNQTAEATVAVAPDEVTNSDANIVDVVEEQPTKQEPESKSVYSKKQRAERKNSNID